MIICIPEYNDFNFNDCVDKVAALENIIKAYGEGKHYVFMPRKLLRYIEKDEGNIFGLITRQYAASLATIQTELKQLLEHTCFYIEVDFRVISHGTVQNSNGTDKITVGYNFFLDSENTQKVSIMGEDSTDVEFYKILSQYYMSSQRIRSSVLSYKPENGGGQNTSKNFTSLAQSGKVCLCLVDNDKSHPNKNPGGTSLAFKETQIYNGKVIIIDAHEVECLIPIPILRDTLKEKKYSKEHLTSCAIIEDLAAIDPSSRLYFDHKEGLSIKKAIQLDSEYGDYWIPILIKNKPALAKNTCVKDNECISSCKCFNVDGFGQHILVNAIDTLKTRHVTQKNMQLDSLLEEQWLHIGKVFFSWACSPRKTRI